MREFVCPNCGSKNTKDILGFGIEIMHDKFGEVIGLRCGNCGFFVKDLDELVSSDEFVNINRTKLIDDILDGNKSSSL
jgi:uncharacterized Zn finger protein